MAKYIEFSKKIRSVIISGCIIISLMITVFPTAPVFGEPRLVKPEWVMPKNYPEWFHGWGRIGYIGDEELVINDMSYPLSPSAEFHTPDNFHASRYLFEPGKLVGFLFNDENVITSVWLITMK